MKKFLLIIETSSDYSIADIASYLSQAECFEPEIIREFLLDIELKAIKEIDEK